jgi:sugar lactone lactonase YvrE
VSEPLAHTIRKITASGIVSTFAGTYGVSNSDNLSFNSPRGLTCDAAGNVYVIDAGNSRIQKISPNGIMSIIFVGVAVGVSYNMVFDSVGNLLLANESYNGGVKKIDTNGVLTNTLFGTTTKSIAIDQSDNIYTANQWGNIIKTTPSGATSNITSGGIGFADGDFAVAKFKGISGLYLDQEGLLYVADTDNNRIRLVSQFGYSVTPALPAGLALNPDGSITGTPNVATAAKDYVVTATNSGGSSSNTLNFAITTIPSLTTTEASAITAITATLGGNVTSDGYASVAARGVCWSTSPNPTIADAKTTNGTGTGIFESAITGLSPVTAYYVRAYATNSVGTVYGNEFSFTTVLPLPIIQYSAAVTYAVNTAITPLAVSNTGGVVINSLAGVSTFAGSTAGYTDGTTNAQFSQPSGVVTDSNGNLFVADSSNNAIRKITPSGTVSTFAGGTSGTADGQGSAAQFLRPNSIAIDSNDNLYISDTGNHLIRKITASGLVSTLAGTAGTAGFVNGTGTSAQFNYPYGLTLDVSGNVYVADNVNNSIRKITPAGVVSTYFVVDYMLRTLDSPTAVAFDSSGNLFISQASSNGLVKILITDSYSELTNFDNNNPIGTITFDTNNTLYAAAGGFIFKAQEPYTSGTLFAGGSQGFADGALLEAKFGGIRGLTIDNEGVMYVADGVNNRIRKISPFGYSISPALPSGLVLNANGSITGTPSEASPATDYVVTATNSGGNSSYLMSITINSAFQAPIASAQTFISGHTVADLVAIGTDLKWYADATGGTALVTTTPLVSGTYYVSQTIDAIESTRTSVEVTVKPLAPTAAPQTFCSGTIADLVAIGTSLKWYDVATNGTALTSTTALATLKYYVSQTENSVESNRTLVAVTVNNSVAGTVSAGQLIVRGTQPAAISLTGNIGLVQWQSSLDKIKFTTIAGATSSMLTGDQMGILTRRRFYRAIIKSGDCSSVTSEVVEVWTTLATQIQDSQCGKTLASLTTNISANAVPGADYYRFKVVVGNTDPKTIVTRSKSFNLKSLEEGALLNTTYTISVATQSIGLWSDYGTECTITTPSGLTKVQNSQCGTTLASLSTNVTADAVAGVTNYRFKVVQGITTRFLETKARYFNLKSLEGGTFYNTTYTVSVATQYNGNWSNYGTECTVTTPSGLTKIKDSQCGTTLASLSTNVMVNAVTGVTNYRFKVVQGETARTIEKIAANFSLKTLVGGTLNGTTYTISVATKYNGVWGDYGQECTISTPAIITPSVSRQAATASVFVQENVLEAVSVVAYPNPFTTTFKLDLQSSSDVNIVVSVYDMNGRLIENKEVKSSEINNLELGNELTSGVYNVIITQGIEVKTVRVIKK